jgi:hypothetical protein
MKVIDERVFDLLKTEPAGLEFEEISKRINKRFPPGYNNDQIMGSLRRLNLECAAESPRTGIWKAVGKWASAGVEKPPVAATPKPTAPDVAPRPTHKPPPVKKCSRCGGSDFTDGRYCRPCKKRYNEAYTARKRGETSAVERLPTGAPKTMKAPLAIPPKPDDPTIAPGNTVHFRGVSSIPGSAVSKIAAAADKFGLAPEADPPRKPDFLETSSKWNWESGEDAKANRMVQPVLMLRLKDSAGDQHDLFFTRETIRQLAIELQEYI